MSSVWYSWAADGQWFWAPTEKNGRDFKKVVGINVWFELCTTVLLKISTVNHNVLLHNNPASSCWLLNKMPKALDSCDPHFLQRNWSWKAASRIGSQLGMSHPWTMSLPRPEDEVGDQCTGDDVFASAKDEVGDQCTGDDVVDLRHGRQHDGSWACFQAWSRCPAEDKNELIIF